MLISFLFKIGRIKSSSEQLQDNKELNRNETPANWKQLAEQTGYYILKFPNVETEQNST